MIRRCMRTLDFLADYPMRVSKRTEAVLYLETDGRERLALYPFVVSGAEIGSGAETYFVDAWDTRKGVARMKSFESGDTVSAPEISEALWSWKGSSAGRRKGVTSDGPPAP